MPSTTPPIALVTGAALRIGRAIVTRLVDEGWAVAIHYRSSEAAARSLCDHCHRAGGKAVMLQADLAEAAEIEGLLRRCTETLGAPGLLVNNASDFHFDDIASLTPQSWDRHQAINLRAPVLLSQAFARALPPERHGVIVNIIDQRVWAPTPEFFSYTASKHALWGATRMLAQALAPRIRVNAIGPGPTLQGAHQSADDFAAEIAATPLRRGTSPDEIAAAVRFILDAPAMTGQMIALDGGQHLRWLAESTPSGRPPNTSQ